MILTSSNVLNISSSVQKLSYHSDRSLDYHNRPCELIVWNVTVFIASRPHSTAFVKYISNTCCNGWSSDNKCMTNFVLPNVDNEGIFF